MPENKKKTEKRALAPADSSRAHTHTRKEGEVKRRAKRTADLGGTAAPRIMRRPKPRRRPQQVTAQFGAITPSGRKRKTGVKPFAKKKVHTVKVKGGRLPWAAMITALCCTVVIMALVINYVRLNEITNKYRALQSEVVGMAADKKSLEQQIDVLEYKEQAEKYGMVGSDRVEKRYIRLQSEDKMIVHEDEENAFIRFVSDVWQDVCSFFANIFGGN